MPVCCKGKRKRGTKTKQKNKNNKKTKNREQKEQQKKHILMKETKIGFVGLRIFVFCFLVSCWLVRCWVFERLAKQQSEGPRPHSLGGANLFLVHFINCCGPVVPLENHVKNHGKMQVSLEEAWGAWDKGYIGNFVCLCNCSKFVLNKCKNIGNQWMCRTDFEIDMVGSKPWVNTCSNTLRIPLKSSDAPLWSECSLQQVHFF